MNEENKEATDDAQLNNEQAKKNANATEQLNIMTKNLKLLIWTYIITATNATERKSGKIISGINNQ